MDADKIVAEVTRIFIDEFELEEDEVVPDATLQEDLGLDSLDAVDMIVLLEQRLGVRVEDKTIAEMETVGDIQQYVVKLVVAKESGEPVAEAASEE